MHSLMLLCFIKNKCPEVGCPSGVVAYMLDYDIVVSEFELQSRYYVLFRTNILGIFSYVLNNISTVLLQGWLWH